MYLARPTIELLRFQFQIGHHVTPQNSPPDEDQDRIRVLDSSPLQHPVRLDILYTRELDAVWVSVQEIQDLPTWRGHVSLLAHQSLYNQGLTVDDGQRGLVLVQEVAVVVPRKHLPIHLAIEPVGVLWSQRLTAKPLPPARKSAPLVFFPLQCRYHHECVVINRPTRAFIQLLKGFMVVYTRNIVSSAKLSKKNCEICF